MLPNVDFPQWVLLVHLRKGPAFFFKAKKNAQFVYRRIPNLTKVLLPLKEYLRKLPAEEAEKMMASITWSDDQPLSYFQGKIGS